MNTNKKKVSNVMLVFIVIAIVVYTIANFLLQYFAGIEVSPTLTTAWFSFWGVEIIALASIKCSKVKHENENTNSLDDIQSEITDESNGGVL